MYANPLVYSSLTFCISILINSFKCTVQLTEHTGRELSSPPWQDTCNCWILCLKAVLYSRNINIYFPEVAEFRYLDSNFWKLRWRQNILDLPGVLWRYPAWVRTVHSLSTQHLRYIYKLSSMIIQRYEGYRFE